MNLIDQANATDIINRPRALTSNRQVVVNDNDLCDDDVAYYIEAGEVCTQSMIDEAYGSVA